MRRTAHTSSAARTHGATQSTAPSLAARFGRILSAPALLALTTLAATGLGACAPIAVVGTAILVNDEFVDNAQTVIVPYEVDYVWKSARSTLSHMTSDLLDVDNDLRAIKTFVDGAEVIVQVETFDVGQTRIRVAAKRYLVYSDEVAVNVRNRIDLDLN
jgi:hypothetical protein